MKTEKSFRIVMTVSNDTGQTPRIIKFVIEEQLKKVALKVTDVSVIYLDSKEK